MQNKPAILEKELLGFAAMWAVRQSPYARPDGLEQALFYFKKHMDAERATPAFQNYYPHPEFVTADKQLLIALVRRNFIELDAVMQWNIRKNKREGPGFVSRYDRPHPDDDFIDLDALLRNIVFSCVTAWEVSHAEHLASCESQPKAETPPQEPQSGS